MHNDSLAEYNNFQQCETSESFVSKGVFYHQKCNVFRVTSRHNIMQRQLIKLFKVAFCLSNACHVLGSFFIMKPACISKCPRWKILFDVIAGETSDFQPMVSNRRLPIANSHKVWKMKSRRGLILICRTVLIGSGQAQRSTAVGFEARLCHIRSSSMCECVSPFLTWDVSVVWVVHAHLGSVTSGGWLSESWWVVSGSGCCGTSGVNALIHRRHHVGGGAGQNQEWPLTKFPSFLPFLHNFSAHNLNQVTCIAKPASRESQAIKY